MGLSQCGRGGHLDARIGLERAVRLQWRDASGLGGSTM
jgi:hypothetical protein